MTEPILNNTEPQYNNLHYLRNLLENDRDAVNDILREISSQWEEDRLHLGQALAENDMAEVKRLLHRIKSTFSPLGAGHVLYQAVLQKGEAFLEERGTLAGDGDYWRRLVETIHQMVKGLQKDKDELPLG